MKPFLALGFALLILNDAKAQLLGADAAIRESEKTPPRTPPMTGPGADYCDAVKNYYRDADRLSPTESGRRWLVLADMQPGAVTMWSGDMDRGPGSPSWLMRVLPSPIQATETMPGGVPD